MSDPGDFDVVPENVYQVACLVDPKTDASWIRVRADTSKAPPTDGVHTKEEVQPGSSSPETLSEAVKILKARYALKAIRALEMKQAVIYCRTRRDCTNLEAFLQKRGYKCISLPDATRRHDVEKFKRGEISFLLLTDGAERGLNLSGVPFVINFSLPQDKSDYVHRIGLAGSDQKMGLAISLVSAVPEKVWSHKCKPKEEPQCCNRRQVDTGGCTTWFDEQKYFEKLQVQLCDKIPPVGADFKVQQREEGGKLLYGSKQAIDPDYFYTHASELKSRVRELTRLEKEVQLAYLKNLAAG